MADVSPWTAPTSTGPLDAVVRIPGSKSLTNRALVLAALADRPSRLDGILRSRDTDLMLGALRALGVGVDEVQGTEGTGVVVTPAPMRGAAVDCGLAGTVMRFLPPVAALAEGDSAFDGDAAARVRPQSTVLDALRALGVGVEGDSLPFTVHGTGRVRGGRVGVDASASSQFVSGLLLSAARFEEGLQLQHTGSSAVPSAPHVEMTVAMLRSAGVEVRTPAPGTWQVHPGPVAGVDRVVEPDLSNATAFLAAAAAVGGTVRIPDWPTTTTQPGDEIRGVLERMGARVVLEAPAGAAAGTLAVTGPSDRLRAVDLDMGAIGELTPTVAALCALADGPSRLTGIAHLRGHETDRLAALAAELDAVGCTVIQLEDGLEIRPGTLRGAPWRTYADHRMATSGALLGLVVPGVEVEDVACTSKTLPGFVDLWTSMLSGPGVADGSGAPSAPGPRV